jgi:hypothetical protein
MSNRLCDVTVASGCACILLVLHHDVRAQRDDDSIAPLRSRAQLTGQLEAIHFGKLDITGDAFSRESRCSGLRS